MHLYQQAEVVDHWYSPLNCGTSDSHNYKGGNAPYITSAFHTRSPHVISSPKEIGKIVTVPGRNRRLLRFAIIEKIALNMKKLSPFGTSASC